MITTRFIAGVNTCEAMPSNMNCIRQVIRRLAMAKCIFFHGFAVHKLQALMGEKKKRALGLIIVYAKVCTKLVIGVYLGYRVWGIGYWVWVYFFRVASR